MKNNRTRKIIYLLGLSAMLSLTSCNTNKETTKKEEKECLENHLDKEMLQIHTLSDGSKYVKDLDVLTSIREQFLKNNRIIDCENIDTNCENFEQLINETKNMHLFKNTEIGKLIVWTMNQLENIYPDENSKDVLISSKCYSEESKYNDINIYIPIQVNDKIYFIDFISNLADEECIDIDIESKNIKFSKYMRANNYSDYYGIVQSYGLSSIEKTDLDKIEILLSSDFDLNYDLITEGIYTCEYFSGKLTLNNDEDKIEIKLTEEEFNIISEKLTNAANQDKTVKQFLEENEELMIELYGEDYQRFIEITKSFMYVKKPV